MRGPVLARFALALLIGILWMAGPAWAEPRAQVRGDLPGDLREKLERAIGTVESAPSSRFEARSRARSALESAEALLRSEGYYQPILEDLVEGESPSTPIVQVTPGPRFALTASTIQWIATAPDPETGREVTDDIGLPAGDPGRAADVIAAEGRIIAGLTRRGYADARTEPRRVVVDHATLTVSPTFRINSGQLVRLDGVRVETAGPTNPDWVAGLAPWTTGDRYSPENVAELERRLLETSVYDGVGVALAPADQTTPDGLRPIIVTLQDRSRRMLEAGATYSTAEGYGVDIIVTRYNRLNRADTLRLEARGAKIDSRLGAELSLPHWRKPGRTLSLQAALVNENTDAYNRAGITTSADLRQRTGKISFWSVGIGLDAGHYNETRFDPLTLTPILYNRDLYSLTGRAIALWDRSNDPLDPTQGWRLLVNAQPTAVTGEDNSLFLRAEAQATAYLPVESSGRTILAGRVRLGSILGAGELQVPSDRLFFSGGGGSVRGFEYQGVGPRWPDNTPRGGTSLFEASFEVRRDVGRNLQAVVFVDAGAIGFQETPNFNNTRFGAGAGVRYHLPFGPIRADVAFPLDRRPGDADFQIYISIGQAF